MTGHKNKPGAGRPPKGGQRHNVMLPAHVWEWLKQNEASKTITRLVEKEIEMTAKHIYTAWMSNEQGASEDVTGRFTSISSIRSYIRAQYGPGWTAHIQAVDIDGDGQSVMMHGESPIYPVESFTIRK